MYTQCPHCKAYFEVSADQLKLGDGDVRCGQCLSIFHALSYLSESLPTQNDDDNAPATVHQEPELGDIDSIADDTPLWSDSDLRPETEQNAEPQNGAPTDDISHDDSSERTADAHPVNTDINENFTFPEETRPEETRSTEEPVIPVEPDHDIYAERIIDAEPPLPANSDNAASQEGSTSHLPAPLLRQLQEEKAASLRPPVTPWVIGSLLMLVIFIAQASYFYRDALAQHEPALRPWLEKACSYLNCDIRRPAVQAKIDILGWDVRTLPDTPQALLASTTLVNKATSPQPYPLLTLRFSDINGAPLAQRRFLPREYLPAGTDFKAGMTPDTPVLVELALVDPGKQAVNFEFHTEPASPSQ